jgi:hypothetical protein
MSDHFDEGRESTWLDFFISYQERPEEYKRFGYLVGRWFSSLTVHDFAVIELEDLLEFIPTKGSGDDAYCMQKRIEELAHDRGMVRVLWRRYIQPKMDKTAS